MDKPSGPTSHDAVGMARRALSQREVGHLGTLDPLATGLLGLLLGPATKLAPYLSGLPKRYLGGAILGLRTDTLDILGRSADFPGVDLGGEDPRALVPPAALALGEGELAAALASLEGPQAQLPPGFSAIKVGGVPSHRLARGGRPPELAPRAVEAHSLRLLSWEPPVARFEAFVSSGYYVRSLARDLGLALGLPGGALCSLRRTAIGPFGVGGALPAGGLSPGAAAASLVSPRDALPWLPEYLASGRALSLILNGGPLEGPLLDLGCLRGPGAPGGGAAGCPAGAGGHGQAGARAGGGAGQAALTVRVTGPGGDLVAMGELGVRDPAALGPRPLEDFLAQGGGPPGPLGLLPARPFLRPRRVLRPGP